MFRMFDSFLLTTSLLLGACSTLAAQNMVVANPAEMTDFRSSFVNPSALAFQTSHAALGGKLFHLGFSDGQTSPFRLGYVSLALPEGVGTNMGLGLQAQYFDSPLYLQSNISFVLSKRIKHIYSVGLRFNIFSRSYNRDNFDLVDPDDPVFRNGVTKWAGTFGAGVSMFPLPFLSLGIGIDHINRANISLNNDSVFQPLAFYGGANLNLGMFMASFSAQYEDGRWLPKTSFGTSIRKQGYAMLGYDQNSFQVEGQWRIGGPLSANYTYEFTIFDNEATGSMGSHALTLIHEFDHQDDLPKFEMPDEFRADFQAPQKELKVKPKFYVYSIVEKLEIIDKKLRRVISSEVTPEQLQQVTRRELGLLDSTSKEQHIPYEEENIDLAKIPAMMDATISDGYRNFLKKMSDDINEKSVKAKVVTSKGSYLRAAGLRQHFRVEPSKAEGLEFLEPVYDSPLDSMQANSKLAGRMLQPYETMTTLSAPSTTFKISPISEMEQPRKWWLKVRNASDQEIKSFEGVGMPTDELRWDWRDRMGNLIVPGVYTYVLEWQDANNHVFMTQPKYISVQKLIRNITIEVTSKPKDTGVDADEIEIILKE